MLPWVELGAFAGLYTSYTDLLNNGSSSNGIDGILIRGVPFGKADSGQYGEIYIELGDQLEVDLEEYVGGLARYLELDAEVVG